MLAVEADGGVTPRRAGSWLAALVALLVVVVPAGLAQAQTTNLPSFADLVAKVAPAVVNVSTRKAVAGHEDEPPVPQFPPGSPFEEFFKDFMNRNRQQQEEPQQRTFSLGSGFIIDSRGFVVTNNHVIADADEITVILHDDREMPARLVGRDTKTDLAVLKIEDRKPLPFVEWADSDHMRVGDWMLAIGNPFGLGSTVTAGIVSALNRDIRAGPYDAFIQVDAAINRGNSGGPSFDLDGKVFGINTAIFSPSGGNVGIGFAVPANLAKPVIQSLIDTGKVARGWLGVRIQTVSDDIAQSLGLKESRGALVASVTPGGPAEKAGIEAGDVILDLDGKPIDRMRSLPRVVAESPVGKDVPVTVWRKGEQKKIQVHLGQLPDDEQLAEGTQGQPPAPTKAGSIDALGVTVSPITSELKAQYKLADSAKGVVVTDVARGSPTAEQSVRQGDLIVEVNQEEVSTAGDVAARIARAKTANKKTVLLLIDRQGDLRFVPVKLKD